MPDLGISVLLKGQNFMRMLAGLGVALKISLISVVISIPLGIVLGVLMTWKNPITKAILRIYLEIVRIMPQMVLLFLVFFGTTRAFGWDLSGENASIIVFTFWGAAEMSDLVRGALISIPKHQYESSEALGLSKVQTYWYIIIPQTLRRLIPLSINLITRMIKTTSLILMIGVVEVLKVSRADHRGKSNEQSKCCIWHLSCSIFIILFRMLANQYACKISGKKMEVIDCGRDITYSRTSDKKIWRSSHLRGCKS